MTKDKKGITLISLAVTIVVMLIILGVTLVSGTALLDNSKLTKIETTLIMIKSRAEILAEQYGFDENIKSILSFSVLEDKHTTPTVFSYGGNYSMLKYKSNNINFGVNVNDKFNNMVERIYPSPSNSTVKVKTVNGEITINRILFVKWGLDECVSQGVINKENQSIDGKEFKSDIIDNTNKYAIVAYDLKTGNVLSVAYSVGYRNEDNVIEYTLEDMLNVDVEEE